MLQTAFLAGFERDPNSQRTQCGLFDLVERALEHHRQQGPQYRLTAHRMCKLLGQCVLHLHTFRPQDLKLLLPAPSHCQRLMELIGSAYNTVIQAGTPGAGRMQEPLASLYNMLDVHRQTQHEEEFQSPGGSAEGV
jgi:hypothetical protein